MSHFQGFFKENAKTSYYGTQNKGTLREAQTNWEKT